MYATDFEFDGKRLSEFGMMICRFDGNSGIETVSSGSDLTFNQTKITGSSRFHLYSATYDTAYTVTFQICKDPDTINAPEHMCLSTELVSSLQRWLCRKEYCKFKLLQEGYEYLYWNSTFQAKQINLSTLGIAGIELTLQTDAPFAYCEEIITEHKCLADTSFDFYDTSDEIGYIYPNLEITILSGDDPQVFCLENTRDHKKLEIGNCIAGETIAIDGKHQLITTSVTSHNIANDFKYYFPKIINTYSDTLNTFTPNRDCNIKISYSPIKKVGL